MDAPEDSKRARTAAAAAGGSGVQPQAWPTPGQLYAAGLSNRAEAETAGDSWAMDGRQLRANTFSAADADGSQLRQLQLEVRRQLLRKPPPPAG